MRARQAVVPEARASIRAPANRRAMPSPPRPFKGNKQALPTKPCAACGRPMTWRKRWARTWAEVKFCSEACRKNGGKT